MVARLEGDDRGATAGERSGRAQRDDLGVRAAGPFVEPFPHRPPARGEQDTPDHRIGQRSRDAEPGQIGGPVQRAELGRGQGIAGAHGTSVRCREDVDGAGFN
jgi:hypothetical protein